MSPNGVSQLCAKDDLRGIVKILEWIGFVRKQKSDHLPATLAFTSDPTERTIEYYPQKGVYDPRWLLDGSFNDLGQSGLFDKGSFVESMSGWAKSIVSGRARLGGFPMGVIAVETRTTECLIPADPADTNSRECIKVSAGQVWFPDSAHKTAQALRDFRGEQIPVMILANWRGFSGGMMDMFSEVLKFGAMIVDELTQLKQPVFIYLPPFAELRGGAWVVLDPQINVDMMEMYADPQSRGGVLEPEGIVEIKCRHAQKQKLMERLDQAFRSLKADCKPTNGREKLLASVYQQICVQFAELHDRPGRMKAKGVIREVVEWSEARRFFYWRLRRRLSEEVFKSRLEEATGRVISKQDMETQLHQLMHLKSDSDREVVEWLDLNTASIDSFLAQKRKERMKAQLKGMLDADLETVQSLLAELMKEE
jgi:acetyl-CoA carboxylase/biotin carboxylase 1